MEKEKEEEAKEEENPKEIIAVIEYTEVDKNIDIETFKEHAEQLLGVKPPIDIVRESSLSVVPSRPLEQRFGEFRSVLIDAIEEKKKEREELLEQIDEVTEGFGEEKNEDVDKETE